MFPVVLIVIATLGNTYASIPYKELYMTQYVDHFNAAQVDTYQQRYLVQNKWWEEGIGPIFFYTGNEGDITAFWKNTGFMFDIAPQFGALIVFAEHRYYGKSLPFGDKSFQQPNISFLTIEQALADYAILLTRYKKQIDCEKCPVIAFGGSYGGMLSAYFRFKYPNIVTGAIAASAPIYLLTGSLNRSFFFEDVTKDFQKYNQSCVDNVKSAFQLMDEMSTSGSEGLKKLSSIFQLCNPLENKADYVHLLGWIRNAFANLAMMDYPYPTKFLSNLPAYPVNVACDSLLNSADILHGLASAAALFYNGSQPLRNLQCFDIKTEFVSCADPTGCGTGTDGMAWDYQACTEIHLPDGTNNITDMFPVLPFNEQIREEYCEKQWNVVPRDEWSSIQFWGKNIASSSNIIFSNGDLDPWHRGGVLYPIGQGIDAVMVVGGAHHLDLRHRNPDDPISVVKVREIHKGHIRIWVNSV